MTEELLRELRASRKYAAMDEALLLRVLEEEGRKHKKQKDVLKAAKNRLHQIHGAYAGDERKALLRLADEGNLAGREQLFLQRHASSRERLKIADAFFFAAFSLCPDAQSVLDLGCGLNPFFLPFMPPTIQRYTALDTDEDAAALINRYFAERALPQAAGVMDLIQKTPSDKADMAFLLKLLPVLEQQKKGRSRELLSGLQARTLAVSFPLRSLGGKQKGMEENYAAFFEGMVKETGYSIRERMAFPNELLYLAAKG